MARRQTARGLVAGGSRKHATAIYIGHTMHVQMHAHARTIR